MTITHVTEQAAWQALRKPLRDAGINATRIESARTAGAGVADVEYVVPIRMAGWLELKAAVMPREAAMGRPLVLKREFTREQFAWLCNHHTPTRWRYSGVLLCMAGEKGWSFVLVPATRCSVLLRENHAVLGRPSYDRLVTMGGVRVAQNAREVAVLLRGMSSLGN